MALNIIVETVIQPVKYYQEKNPIYDAGTVVFDQEGFRIVDSRAITGVKIGDGAKPWLELPYLNVTEEIVSKWRQIAEKGISDGRLVTLPDLNFAYMIIDVENNQELIKEILDFILKEQLQYNLVMEDSVLKLECAGMIGSSLPQS